MAGWPTLNTPAQRALLKKEAELGREAALQRGAAA